MEKIKKITILFILVTFIGVGSINAQGNSENENKQDNGNIDQVIDTAREVQEQTSGSEGSEQGRDNFKCKTTSSKMDKIEERYRKNFEKHKDTYLNIVGRVEEMLDELDEKGYDTEKARESNLAFRAQVEATENDFNSFSQELSFAKKNLCEDDVSGFRESLKQSKNQLRVLRNNMLKLRSEFQNSVKPDLLGIREQIRERVEEETDIPTTPQVDRN